jgi:glycosyltransferase involved in cell wall biosynthesis
MKILVFAHKLDLGGSQVNAIELAASLRDLHGIDVVLFATPGPMVELVKEKGIRFLAAPDPRRHPSPARTRALRDAVRRERPDLIHVWDWWQCLDAYYSVHLPMRIPMVVSDMTMNVTRILPKELPTTFGTPNLVEQARASGRPRVELLLPPVDVNLNAPRAVDPKPFRERHGIKDGDITLVTVSRLDVLMKSESLLRTVACVRTLGHELPLRFVIAGDGTARTQIDRLADEVNAELGRPAVVLTGALLDPRPAYAAADIVVGMGGSALRGMAFGKPVIIVGEKGFSAPFTPQTAESFYQRGFYGLGDGGSSNARLVAQIRSLADHPDQRLEFGKFSSRFVVRHFSLETVSALFAAFCRSAATAKPPIHASIAGGLRTTAVYLRERTFLWSWAPVPSRTVESRRP